MNLKYYNVGQIGIAISHFAPIMIPFCPIFYPILPPFVSHYAPFIFNLVYVLRHSDILGQNGIEWGKMGLYGAKWDISGAK